MSVYNKEKPKEGQSTCWTVLFCAVNTAQRKKQTYTTASALSKTINDDWAQEALLAVEVESYLKKKSCKNRLQEAADAYF